MFGCLADGVAAGRGCGAAGAELVPLVRAAVPDVDAKAPRDVLGRQGDGVVVWRRRCSSCRGRSSPGRTRAPGRCARGRGRPSEGPGSAQLCGVVSADPPKVRGHALGEIQTLERRAVHLELDHRVRRLAPGRVVAQAEHAVEDLGAGSPRLGEEVRQGRTRRRHEVGRGRGGRQLGSPGRRHAHLDRRAAGRPAGRPRGRARGRRAAAGAGTRRAWRSCGGSRSSVSASASGGSSPGPSRTVSGCRNTFAWVRSVLGLALRRRGEGAELGVRVHGLELVQSRLSRDRRRRDLPVRGPGPLSGPSRNRVSIVGHSVLECRVAGIGRDVEVAHVPGG